MLLQKLFAFMIREGTLSLIDAAGKKTTYGNGSAPNSTVRLHNQRLEYTIPLNPALYFAEAYMEGTLTFEDSNLEDFLEVSLKNFPHLEKHWLMKIGNLLRRQTRRVKQYNPIRRARRNVAHHYDLSGKLYDLFLDNDRQYSCAYFTSPHGDLERAQADKKRHIAAKLLLDRPNLKLLDIGSGWGGLGIYFAEQSGCDVTGLTLSKEQLAASQQRVKKAGLDQRIRFHLRDYREENGTYDRIVSVGMFEHVGKKHYDEYFERVRDLMTDDGVCLIHSIGKFANPGPINSFIQKYIFPGGDLPLLSMVFRSVERAGLLVTDVEILRLHYATTLRLWHDRFQANRSKVARLYDERFCRMWELYLKACEIGFYHQDLMVFQLQLAKKLDTVPLTRDYIYEQEHGDLERRAHAAE